jgi:hypothetical protein
LRAYHLERKPHQIAAVKIGLMHCSVWFGTDAARTKFYRGLVQLLREPELIDEKGLLHSVQCFPYKSMRAAIDDAAAAGDQSPDARRRLKEARRLVMRAYRE